MFLKHIKYYTGTNPELPLNVSKQVSKLIVKFFFHLYEKIKKNRLTLS